MLFKRRSLSSARFRIFDWFDELTSKSVEKYQVVKILHEYIFLYENILGFFESASVLIRTIFSPQYFSQSRYFMLHLLESFLDFAHTQGPKRKYLGDSNLLSNLKGDDDELQKVFFHSFLFLLGKSATFLESALLFSYRWKKVLPSILFPETDVQFLFFKKKIIRNVDIPNLCFSSLGLPDWQLLISSRILLVSMKKYKKREMARKRGCSEELFFAHQDCHLSDRLPFIPPF